MPAMLRNRPVRPAMTRWFSFAASPRWIVRAGALLGILGLAVAGHQCARATRLALGAADRIPPVGFSGATARAHGIGPAVGLSRATHATPPADRPVPAEWRQRWRPLKVQAPSPERDQALIAALEEVAGIDPALAARWARSEADAALRGPLLHAVLRRWASQTPQAAYRWTLALPETERADAMAAVISGAAQQADEDVRLASQLCRDDPIRAREYGDALISALSGTGAHRAAVRFAILAAPTGEGEEGMKWLQAAMSEWSRQDPESAALASLRLRDPGMRFEALMAVIPQWVQLDPAGAAEVMREVPEAVDRRNLLDETLRRWAETDPVQAGRWMTRFDPSPDFDAGVATLASLPSLVACRPDVAVSWAETIMDPQLRARTLAAIRQPLVAVDPATARDSLEPASDTVTGEPPR